MGIDWKNIGKGEIPLASIDCCLVMYKDDYEFGKYDGKSWQVYYESVWNDVSEDVRFWARLNRPD